MYLSPKDMKIRTVKKLTSGPVGPHTICIFWALAEPKSIAATLTSQRYLSSRRPHARTSIPRRHPKAAEAHKYFIEDIKRGRDDVLSGELWHPSAPTESPDVPWSRWNHPSPTLPPGNQNGFPSFLSKIAFIGTPKPRVYAAMTVGDHQNYICGMQCQRKWRTAGRL